MAKPIDPNPLQASADSDAALLAQFGFSDLPVMFAMRDNGGGVIQEKEPCYQCRADGFYGRGRLASFYQEGDIIVLADTPNQHLEPLNRAAAVRWAKWASHVPAHRAAIDIGDMSEAAHMLAKDPRVTDLDPLKYQEAVMKLAVEIKLRREGKNAREIPSMGHNFAPQSGQGSAVPLLGAKVSDLSQRGPGGEARTASAGEIVASGARRASAAPASATPLGGSPTPTR